VENRGGALVGDKQTKRKDTSVREVAGRAGGTRFLVDRLANDLKTCRRLQKLQRPELGELIG
jgi:hypothetical protein